MRNLTSSDRARMRTVVMDAMDYTRMYLVDSEAMDELEEKIAEECERLYAMGFLAGASAAHAEYEGGE